MRLIVVWLLKLLVGLIKKLAIWGESNIQEELDDAVRNKVVYQEISEKLQQQGYCRDWEQCRTKIKNLKNTEL